MTAKQPGFLAKVAEVRQRLTAGSGLFGAAIRPVTAEEAATLRAQGNLITAECQIWAGPGFRAEGFYHNRLSGRLVLAAAEVFFSDLEDCEVGDGAQIRFCPRVRRSLVGARAELCHASLDCSAPSWFGCGVEISAGLETAGRELPVHPDLTLDEAVAGAQDPAWRQTWRQAVSPPGLAVSVVGPGARLNQVARADRIWCEAGAVIDCALVVENSCLLTGGRGQTLAGAGVIVQDSILQNGAQVDSAAQVRQSILLEHSHAERGAFVTASLLGPNTGVAEGEVTASLLGPFVGFHHQSLLIAAWWPQGRGNVGYGANIGSNHTSRAPDQEIRPGEGLFFGLSTAIKFPANFEEAPYSLIATGVTTLPQKFGLPFSLIQDEPGPGGLSPALNRVIPGWVLRENVYSLLRNERKYQDRDQAEQHRFDFRIFRPEIVDKLWTAWEKLGGIPVKPVHTAEDLPELGKNWLLESDRIAGVAIYQRFLQYAVARLYAENRLEGRPLDLSWWQELRAAVGLSELSAGALIQHWYQEELRLWQEALTSKQKDDRRGQAVIPDYKTVHGPAEADSFLVKRKNALLAQEKEILSLVENLWENRA